MLCSCRMKVWMYLSDVCWCDISRKSKMDPLTWFSQIGCSCISLIKKWYPFLIMWFSFYCKREEILNLIDGMQVELLAERMLGWVKPGPYIFFRESCFHQSWDRKRKSNPTHYRAPRFYTEVCCHLAPFSRI